ncbi:bifunctional Ribonuclease II-R/Nucleic acid-binding [Babesia duncani]|uniref:Ribosomal RNA-processing protein 44 n=1 Tax=Babesia duncani TaxID=323732 RepID=A0AAD9UQ36_9APIC|nr:bifunctional Ribonuclease II-R/Nucleic acid-binding [Babesia duncani]
MDTALDNTLVQESLKRTLHSFYKITGRSNIRKITREVYFRNDISCGISGCLTCPKSNLPGILDPNATIYVLTVDIILKQMTACEKWLRNCIITATVANEVNRRSKKSYGKLKELLKLPEGGYYYFSNENFKDTFERELANESVAERDYRAVVSCARWYKEHLKGTQVILLVHAKTDDIVKLHDPNLELLTIQELAQSLEGKVPNVMEFVVTATSDDDVSKSSFGNAQGAIDDKAIYPMHLSEMEMQRGIESGKYYRGKLTMYVGSYLHGFVSCDSEEYKISGALNLNRAIDGDFVCVELITGNTQSPHVLIKVTDEPREEEQTEEALLDAHMEEQPVELVKRHCRVVGILKRNWRQYCGSLMPPLDESIVGESYNITECIFIPVDVRIPFIKIETKMAKNLYNKRLVVAIDSWSRYSNRPSGHWVEIIGDVDNVDVESQVIFKEHDVITREFSSEAYKELPPDDWQIPQEEIERRFDFRNHLIFSIDPPGCKDIDDALGFRRLPNGNLEFSVHIADVTHFVRPNSALDQEASQRCTTVYLVDRRTDMLPSLLTTNLCSLVANQNRLTFSVVWEMTNDGCIVSTRFYKGIINSVKAFTYKEAQQVIDSDARTDIAIALREMNRIAKLHRSLRFQRGAVHLESSDVKFEFENRDIETLEPYVIYDTNQMVEEFMLLANMHVASEIYKRFPKCTLCRRHPAPVEERLNALKRALECKGLPRFEFASAKKLNASLEQISKGTNKSIASAIRIMTTRCMSQAVYCSSGDVAQKDFNHYGLAADLYTHFTSPIRRYADILVHRLLSAAIGIDSLPMDLQYKLTEQCEMLNKRHRNAHWCSRHSVKLFAHLYFKCKVQFSLAIMNIV